MPPKRKVDVILSGSEDEGAAAPAAKKPRVTKADAGAPAAKKPAAPRGKKEPEEVFEEGASLERNRMMAELISALAADRKAKEDVWGSRGLAKAADALRGAEFPITSAKQAQDTLAGVGKGTAALIAEFLKTGTIAEAAALMSPDDLVAKDIATQLPGIQMTAVKSIVQEFNCKSADDFLVLAHERPEIFDAAVLPYLRHHADAAQPVARATVAALDAALPGILKEVTAALPGGQELTHMIVGGYRRGQESMPNTGIHVLLTSPAYLTNNPAHSERVKLKAKDFPVLDRLAGVLRTRGILSRSEITAVREDKGDDHFEAWIRVPGPGEAAPKTEPDEPGYNLKNTGAAGGAGDLPPLEATEEGGAAAAAPAPAPAPAAAAVDTAGDVFGDLEVPDPEALAAAEASKAASGRLVTHAKGAAMKVDPGLAAMAASSSSAAPSSSAAAKALLAAASKPQGFFKVRFTLVPHNCFGFYCVVETGSANFVESIKGKITRSKVMAWSKSAWLPMVSADDPGAQGAKARAKKAFEGDDSDAEGGGAGGSAKLVPAREGLACTSEEEWFSQIGMAYVPPSERN